MLKKYFLVLFFLTYASGTYASFWDDVGGCLTDPCNCGVSNRQEYWNGELKRDIKPGSLCPPWNRTDGRNSDNCLIQFDFPGSFTGFYMEHCAERTAESNYFAPKIRLRTQSCNAAACWSQSTTLDWNGDCVTWPGAYGLPLLRICARIAVPKVDPTTLNQTGTPADPGYTVGTHLNEVGYTDGDTPIILEDGSTILFESPKLCAYSDPGLVNLVSATGAHLDPMDWNPTNQILHFTTATHPIIKVLIFLVETGGSMNTANMLSQVLSLINADEIPGLNVIQEMLKAIAKLFEMFAGIIVGILKTVGTLNGSVDSYQFGCVELPFGPFPPPYCPTLGQFLTTPTIQNICSVKKLDGTFDQSSTIAPCVVSRVNNNFVNNAVRISLDNLVPLCVGLNPDTTKCIQIQNAGIASGSAQGIHTMTANHDLIKPCSAVSAGTLCINTQIPLSCSVSPNGCNDGFRVIYSQNIGNGDTAGPNAYYISDMPDCGNPNASVCQKIWGINIGEFIDASLTFPKQQLQDNNNLMPLEQVFTLKDSNGTTRSFRASIARNTITHSDINFQQEPTDICVFDSGELVDCTARVNSGYKMLTYECGGHAGINCSGNTYYKPSFLASIQVQDPSGNIINETNTIVTPLSVSGSPNSTDIESIINLAGYNFSSFMAFIPEIPPKKPGDVYSSMPFSGPHSLNQLSIFGKYKNDETPYDLVTGAVNNNAVYLTGVEYINGKYIHGGTHGCLLPKLFDHCTPKINEVNCVLAGLTAKDTIDCKNFKDKYNQYTNLSICTDTSGCSQVDSVAGTPGKQGLTIYKCVSNGLTSHCYNNNDNLNQEVCILSRDTDNRIAPSANLGPILNDSQYYEVQYNQDNSGNDTTPKYNMSISDLRDKTSQELGLCTPVPVPVCSAITTPNAANGNALWPETEVGEISKGTCPDKWVTIDPNILLERYCLSNANTQTIAFEALDPNEGCRESTGIYIPEPNTNLPAQVEIDNLYDENTKIGTFRLNKKPDNDGAFPDDVIITQPGLYYVNFTFQIDALMNDVEYFNINEVAYDDCVLIKINGQKVLSEPTDTDALTSLAQCNGGVDQGKVRYSSKTPIDVLSKLVKGENTISFQLGVHGKGGLYYLMQYKMRR